MRVENLSLLLNGLLYVNEYVDDKRLGLWMKTLLDLDPEKQSPKSDEVKAEMLLTYVHPVMAIHLFHLPWCMFVKGIIMLLWRCK